MVLFCLWVTYPYTEGSNKKWLIIILFGIFVALFLLSFKPFGLKEIKTPNINLIISGYDIITVLTMIITYIIFPAIFKNFYNEKKWTALREIFTILITICFITLFNILYSFFFRIEFFSLDDSLIHATAVMFAYTILVGMIPVSVMILIIQNSLLKSHLKQAKNISNVISNNKLNKKNILKQKV